MLIFARDAAGMESLWWHFWLAMTAEISLRKKMDSKLWCQSLKGGNHQRFRSPTPIGSTSRRDLTAILLGPRISNSETSMYWNTQFNSLFSYVHTSSYPITIFIFFRCGEHFNRHLCSLLLIMAVVEKNLGPRIWMCSVCNKPIRKTLTFCSVYNM